MLYLHFSVCHVVSRLVAPSFSMANSLISTEALFAARERYKNTFSKVIFNINCNKIDLKVKTFFCEKNQL